MSQRRQVRLLCAILATRGLQKRDCWVWFPSSFTAGPGKVPLLPLLHLCSTVERGGKFPLLAAALLLLPRPLTGGSRVKIQVRGLQTLPPPLLWSYTSSACSLLSPLSIIHRFMSACPSPWQQAAALTPPSPPSLTSCGGRGLPSLKLQVLL